MSLNMDLVNLSVDGVVSIVVSPIQPDPTGQFYVRLVQIYNSSDINARPCIQLTLNGGDQPNGIQTPLEIAVPASDM